MRDFGFNFDQKKEKRKKLILYTILSVTIMVTIFFFLNVLLSKGKVAPGVKIADIPIGGVDKKQAEKIINEYLKTLKEDPINININGKIETVTPKDIGINFQKKEILKDALSFKKSINPITYVKEAFISEYNVPIRVAYDKEKLKALYNNLKKKYETEPKNAILRNKKKIIRGKDGIRFKTDFEKFEERLITASVNKDKRDVNIEIQYIEPDITFRKILTKLGLSTLISTYKTSIKEKEEGSRFNVLLAAKKIDGTIVYPGEEFSYNKIVGPAEKNDGFQKGLVIVGGKFVPGYGGGVCQTSSTLYNALLLAGLKITERHNHSVYADATSYVPLGQDAAVYYGHKDLKFKNNLSFPIVIGAYKKGDYLIIEIWGGKKPDTKYSVITKGKEIISYKTIYKKDKNLPKGKEIIEREGINGYRVKTYLVIEKDGERKEKLLSYDYYHPIDKIVRIGK